MEIKQIPIHSIKFYEKNTKEHPQEQVDKIANSIKKFGFNVPVILDKDHTLIAGHGRVLAAKKMGMTEVPAILKTDLTEDQIRAYRIADNKTAESDWNTDYLKEEFEALLAQGFDMIDTGFDQKEINSLLGNDNELEDMKDIEAEEAEGIKTDIKPGDLFQLGNHRLLCGDATKKEDWDKLMDGSKAQCMITDPPYGVSYKGTNNPNGKKWEVIKGDDKRGDELYGLLNKSFTEAFKNTLTEPAAYIFYASSNTEIFFKAIQEAGFILRQQLIWAKGHILGHSHYHWSHEPIMYASKEKQAVWYADRTKKTLIMGLKKADMEQLKKEDLIDLLTEIKDNSSVLEQSKGNVMAYEHPTQKPVKLYGQFLKNSSKAEDIVIDPFAGSGTLIQAAEQMNRTACCMELDPKYCQVIINRWEKLTESKAKKVQ